MGSYRFMSCKKNKGGPTRSKLKVPSHNFFLYSSQIPLKRINILLQICVCRICSFEQCWFVLICFVLLQNVLSLSKTRQEKYINYKQSLQTASSPFWKWTFYSNQTYLKIIHFYLLTVKWNKQSILRQNYRKQLLTGVYPIHYKVLPQILEEEVEFDFHNKPWGFCQSFFPISW